MAFVGLPNPGSSHATIPIALDWHSVLDHPPPLREQRWSRGRSDSTRWTRWCVPAATEPCGSSPLSSSPRSLRSSSRISGSGPPQPTARPSRGTRCRPLGNESSPRNHTAFSARRDRSPDLARPWLRCRLGSARRRSRAPMFALDSRRRCARYSTLTLAGDQGGLRLAARGRAGPVGPAPAGSPPGRRSDGARARKGSPYHLTSPPGLHPVKDIPAWRFSGDRSCDLVSSFDSWSETVSASSERRDR